MAFVQENAWNSTSIAANVASTTTSVACNGSGFELVVFIVTVDTSNSCTGVSNGGHANFTPGATYTGLSAAGVLNVVLWGIYTGVAGSPSFTLTYTGGNSGTNGGKLAVNSFTGAATNIIASPGPSASATNTSATASVSLSGVSAGSLSLAVASDSGAHTFTAGSGYTLIFNTSAWGGNITGYVNTTGLSEAGGSPTINMTLTSSTWNMLGVNFPAQPSVAAAGSLVYSQRKVLYFI